MLYWIIYQLIYMLFHINIDFTNIVIRIIAWPKDA